MESTAPTGGTAMESTAPTGGTAMESTALKGGTAAKRDATPEGPRQRKQAAEVAPAVAGQPADVDFNALSKSHGFFPQIGPVAEKDPFIMIVPKGMAVPIANVVTKIKATMIDTQMPSIVAHLLIYFVLSNIFDKRFDSYITANFDQKSASSEVMHSIATFVAHYIDDVLGHFIAHFILFFYALKVGNTLGRQCMNVRLCRIRLTQDGSKQCTPAGRGDHFMNQVVTVPLIQFWTSFVVCHILNHFIDIPSHPVINHFIGGLNLYWAFWDSNGQTLAEKYCGMYDVGSVQGEYQAEVKEPGFYAQSGPLKKIVMTDIICPKGMDVPLASPLTKIKGNIIDLCVPAFLGSLAASGRMRPGIATIYTALTFFFLLATGNSFGKDIVNVRMCFIRNQKNDGSKLITPLSLFWTFVYIKIVTPFFTLVTFGLNVAWMFVDKNSQTLGEKWFGIYEVHEYVVGGGKF